ncbi:MAG TPA: hypothetical protein DCZ91_26330 [Lachnospiraceae bacterium]|nr:hypothetical protein [Lachnospiraceae bacterium]
MDNNRPGRRERNVSGSGKTMQKRGNGLGTGSAGSADGYRERGKEQSGRPGTRSARSRSGAGLKLVLLLAVLLGGGGGSVSGYGYDEKFSSSGSMNLSGLTSALKACNVKFNFIGFDACLMATAETALTLSPYADYLIASEETEPGVGWYYTDWLTSFGEDTSIPL